MLLENKIIIKNLKKGIWESFISIFLISLFALVLWKNPENFIAVAIHIFGYVAIFIGVIDLVIYSRLPKNERMIHKKLRQSAIFCASGIVAFFETEILKNMITVLIGGYLIFQNASRLELDVYIKKDSKKVGLFSLIISLLNIILALILIINPFSYSNTNLYISVLTLIIEVLLIIQNILVLFGVRYEKEDRE